MTRLLVLFFVVIHLGLAQGVTYVVLWFDTEDYVDPIADDAALQIANDLTQQGVRATFKVVGEKARVLRSRGRQDVIAALSRHSIGYHSDWHSIQPVPALDLQHLGWLEGTEEFYRRQAGGFQDVGSIFGIMPVCYGQPGSSWAPQSNPALRRMGIRVYLDEGTQVGVNDQPIWYNNLLYVFNMGPYQIRADLDGGKKLETTLGEFDAAARKLSQTGGGLISTVYHPTEFVHTEFWDAVNFSEGATRPRDQWRLPQRRTPAEAARCLKILHDYVEHARNLPGVQFVTADDLLRLYAAPIAPMVDSRTLAQHFSQQGITFLSVPSGDLSAADILLQLLQMPPEYVDGPTFQGRTTYRESSVPEFLFESSIQDVKSFIQTNHRLPSEVFVGSQTLSLPDFAATLASHILQPGPVRVAQGKTNFEKYFSTDAVGSFRWPIHPKGFAPAELLELARLQGWTLKPARLSAKRQ
jgi:hypothetical protein